MEWQPDPLAPPMPAERRDVATPVVTGEVGRYLTADGVQLLNFVSTNFLGIAGDPTIEVATPSVLHNSGSSV